MNYDDWHEQIPTYALGALAPHEAAALEKQLAAEPSLRASLAEYHRVVGELAVAAPPIVPPARVKVALMAEVTSQTVAPRLGRTAQVRTQPRRWWVPRAAAFATACLLVLLATSWATTTAQLRQAMARAEQANAQLATAQATLNTLRTEQQALGAKLAVAEQNAAQSSAALEQRTSELQQISQQIQSTQQALVSLSADTVTSRSLHAVHSEIPAQGAMFMKPGHSDAVILVRGLPTLGQAQSYQFWLADNAHQVNAGKLDVDANGTGRLLINITGSVDTFAQIMITVEQRESPPTPSDNVVLQGVL